jgi:hypothetical protein
MNLDDYPNALGREAMPDYWQQMDLERRAWEEDQACQAEYDSWAETLKEKHGQRESQDSRA